MKEKNYKLGLIFVVLWVINFTEANVAKCDYTYNNYWTTVLYKTTNASYYTCSLSTIQANYDEKITRIDGQHETEQSDADVTCIINYKNNKLKTLTSIFCQKFPNLEIIKINDAELESIDEDSLLNCKNLDLLLLYGNKLRELPATLLSRNPRLTLFNFNNNQLTTLPENFFLNQKNLEDLNMKDNQIKSLPSNIFHSLVKLEVLYLNINKLVSIDPEWFVNLKKLKWLYLKENQITEIPSKCFASLRNLEKLLLSENRIKIINSNSFDGLQNLKILKLSDNEISDLPIDVFAQLKNLQQLNLIRDKLTSIHSDSFRVHNQFKRVYLQHNNINSIDPKFIDNTAVSLLNMTNNICSQISTRSRSRIKLNFKRCFDNYQPRDQYQPQVSQTISPFHNQLSAASQNICGISSTGQGNIVGGSQISRGSFPWLAALVQPSGEYFCGGTLVSDRKVLTAAHCIQGKHTPRAISEKEFVVQLGAHDLNKTVEVGRFPYAVETINVHPNWNTLTEAFDYDIAVLVLESEVTFNKYIQPICMPNLSIMSIKSGIVFGFGKSEDTKKIHENIPKMIETPIHENADCFLKYYLLATLSSKRTFCGGTGTGIGVCRGDSGGGLIVTDGSAYYLRGIVSSSLLRGPYGCDLNAYSIFTDVTNYIDWINGISTSRF